MDVESIKIAYRRYAQVYDTLFGPILNPGRRLIVQELDCRPGDRILEVGVGTGLSLGLYPPGTSVTGIDISKEMLAKARARVEKEGLQHVEAVSEMNAEEMQFDDDSFDKVVAMYIVSVVQNPSRLMREMRRVCKPGGDIFIVNHFRSLNPLVSVPENLLSPLSKLVGFHPDLDLDEFIEKTQLEDVQIRSANLFGYWKVLHWQNTLKRTKVA